MRIFLSVFRNLFIRYFMCKSSLKKCHLWITDLFHLTRLYFFFKSFTNFINHSFHNYYKIHCIASMKMMFEVSSKFIICKRIHTYFSYTNNTSLSNHKNLDQYTDFGDSFAILFVMHISLFRNTMEDRVFFKELHYLLL
jgi:hypothetical protein